jgi:hypothetical protein
MMKSQSLGAGVEIVQIVEFAGPTHDVPARRAQRNSAAGSAATAMGRHE